MSDIRCSKRWCLWKGILLVVGTILASCAPHAVPTSPTALPPTPTFTAEPTETITPTPTSTPLSFLGIGVETSLPPDEGKLTQTPVPVIPIDQLTAEDIKSKTGQGGTYPAGFMDSGRVKNELNLRVQWLSELGLNTTDKNAANYRQVVAKTFGTGDNFRYTWVIQDAKSHDLWLMIKDPGMKSGWRFADSPSWDSHLKPTDIKKFGLPQPLNPDDQFVIFDNGENVQLAELDKNGNPLRVLDTLKQEMRLLSGVEIPHSYDIVTSSVIPHDVISEFQTRAENMTPTGSEFMVNGQPVPDGYWGESQFGMTGTGGSFFFSEAVIVGRFLGVMPINYVDGDFGSSNTAIGFTVQLNEYQRVVLVMPLNIQTRYFNLVKDNDVPSPETIFSGHNGYVLKPPTAENFYRILSEISIGTRAYFTIPHNYPDALKNESDTWIKRDSVQTPFAESIENGLPPTIPVVDGKIGVFFIDAFGFPIEIQDILK